VAHGLVERREQELMRGAQHDQGTADAEAVHGLFYFGAVIRDVLEHVDVEHGVEAAIRRQVGHGADLHRPRDRRRHPRQVLPQLMGQLRIRLEARPAAQARAHQQRRVGPDACSDLQHVAAKECRQLGAPVALPVDGTGKDLELLSDVLDAVLAHRAPPLRCTTFSRKSP
jgi:hypothetical protein